MREEGTTMVNSVNVSQNLPYLYLIIENIDSQNYTQRANDIM